MVRPKSVGVNLLWLDPGVVGGSEEYTVRLLHAVEDQNRRLPTTDQLDIRLYARPSFFGRYPELANRFEHVTSPKMSDAGFGRKASRIVTEHSWLAATSRHEDLLHHAGGTVPLVRGATSVVTIHDLQPLEYPEHFSRAKRAWLSSLIPRSARAARMVLCPSQFTADRVAELLGVSPSRIRVVPQGHKPAAPLLPDTPADGQLKDKYGRFLLYPAISYPHKRHRDLIDVLHRLADVEDLQVVFTGREGPSDEALRDQAERLGLQDRVHLLGRVPLEHLLALYRSAAATVFPSTYEGFGNPALEAMVNGCPLIVSDAGALPEVVGDAGIVVPAGDVGQMAAAVSEVLSDPNLVERLVASGRKRATEYDWGSAGSALLAVYQEASERYLHRPAGAGA